MNTKDPFAVVPTDAQLQQWREVWRTALTLANNLCVQISDQVRDDDGPPEYSGAASDCAGKIRGWIEATDEQLLEMLYEANAIPRQGAPRVPQELTAEAVESELRRRAEVVRRYGHSFVSGPLKGASVSDLLMYAARTVALIRNGENADVSATLPVQAEQGTMTPNLKAKLLKDVYDDGQDHHPPGYVARKGDVVLIHSIQTAVVSHQGAGNGFVVHDGELELTQPVETTENVAADSYWAVADVLKTQSGWSVIEHVEWTRELLEKANNVLRELSEGRRGYVSVRTLCDQMSACLQGEAPNDRWPEEASLPEEPSAEERRERVLLHRPGVEQVGEVTITTNPAGECVAVTRTDAEGRILQVIWERS